MDAQARKALERQEGFRSQMQKAKADAAHVAQTGSAGGVASAASKFKKLGKGKKPAAGKDAGKGKGAGAGSTVGSEKASIAAAAAGAKGKAPSHAIELAASYFAFPTIARMRRLRF